MRMESFTSLVHTESTTDHSFGVSLHIGTRTYLPRFKETQGTPTSATADQPRLAAKGMPMIARAAMASFPGLIREGHLAVLLEVDILASFLYDCYISIYIHIYFYKDLSGTVRNDHIVQYSIDHCLFMYIIFYMRYDFPFHITYHHISFAPVLTLVFHLSCQVRRFVAEWQTTWTGSLLPPGPSGNRAI